MLKTTLSIQIIKYSLIVKGIFVAIIHGMDAEKNSISETLTIAIKNLVIIWDSVTNKAGKNISAILNETAFAASNGSGTLVIKVNG